MLYEVITLPFVLLAYIWGWSLPVMQFSYLGGPFLLSFITFAVFSTPYILWRNKNAKTGLTLFAFSLIVICVVWGYGYLRIKNTVITSYSIHYTKLYECNMLALFIV